MMYEINDKPQELMTEEELDQHYLKRTGKTYKEFIKGVEELTDKEKEEYGLK